MDHRAPVVYPTLRYDNAPSAINFLTEAFGLVPGEVVRAPDGLVVHAELSWRDGVVMISSRRAASGGEPDVFNTGRAVLYLATEDPDAVHERAVAAGARIVLGLTDQEYGSREFAAADPEDNIWCFGTYRPAATVHTESPPNPRPHEANTRPAPVTRRVEGHLTPAVDVPDSPPTG